MVELAFACRCGAIRGVVRDISQRTGVRAECFCTSCRAGEIKAGGADPAPGPVGIFQTTPDRLEFTQGADKLAVFSFGEKNLLRWYAPCCGTAMFNTTRNPKISFVGIRTALFEDPAPFGPVRGQGYAPSSFGRHRHSGLATLVWGFIQRTIRQLVTGKWRDNPLFDTETATPIAVVTPVPEAERKALLSGTQPERTSHPAT